MALTLPQGMEVKAEILPAYEDILTPEALALVAKLHRAFQPRRRGLLAARIERARRLDTGERPDFLPETKAVRRGGWKVAPTPPALYRRRVGITGPVDAKVVINAFSSGAGSCMTDFEDSNSPSQHNQIQGQVNLKTAIRRTLTLGQNGKTYGLNDKVVILQVRPRGWHLDEKHVLIDSERVSDGIFDFALSLFHNAKEQIARDTGLFFYLPKMESHLEARLWNDIFVMARNEIGLSQDTIKAAMLIKAILIAFEMGEILYELREHSAGLSASRWDYIFSYIRRFKVDKNFYLAGRARVTMTSPFMCAYAPLLLKICHKHGAPVIGGVNTLIPIKNDPEKNAIAMADIISDKKRDTTDGYDGGWVTHPGLVEPAMKGFVAVLDEKPNQFGKQRPDMGVKATDLLDFQPKAPITEGGLCMNINVGIYYLGTWLTGNDYVPIHNLMGDAATTEISRSRVWQWICSPKSKLEDGAKVAAELVRKLIPEELTKVRETGAVGHFGRAAEIFEQVSTSEDSAEFLTLPLYKEI